MARWAERLSNNAGGDFFVDRSCIDCETCRVVAPGVFRRDTATGQAIVAVQPTNEQQHRRAMMALVACPTSSIGNLRGDGGVGARAAAQAFPEQIGEGIYYCGYAAESSFGAASYLIRRAQGNVLVDSPRAARPLIEGLRALGGVRFMFLTHRDDVADHAKFRREFACERIIHACEVDVGTAEVERQVAGDEPFSLADDLTVIPVPGHTRGSLALLHGRGTLFTGDHLWADEDSGRLEMGRSVCWYSWPQQLRSLERLRAFSFDWVLPGHGQRYRAASSAAMRDEIELLLRRYRHPARPETLAAG